MINDLHEEASNLRNENAELKRHLAAELKIVAELQQLGNELIAESNALRSELREVRYDLAVAYNYLIDAETVIAEARDGKYVP